MMSVNGENRVWVSALLMLVVPMSQSKMNASSSIPFTWCMTMRKKEFQVLLNFKPPFQAFMSC